MPSSAGAQARSIIFGLSCNPDTDLRSVVSGLQLRVPAPGVTSIKRWKHGKRQVLDCDVQSFFDKVSQDWLIRFVEHRIGDRRIIRLITKCYFPV